jgi:NADH dehydrogenase
MHTVIVGGGFAGVRAALMIDKYKLGKVTLVSDVPYFLHHATLYATATGRNKAESVIPLEEIFADSPNVKVVLDKMKSIEPRRKIVVGEKDDYNYDNLIIAIGCVTTYFNINGMCEHCFGIKSLKEVEEFSQHIHEEILVNKHLDKNYFIVGAGPTGVELAASLQEHLQHQLKTHKNTYGKIRITLVEAANRILPRSSDTASRLIEKRLHKMDIKILTSHSVESLDDGTITISGKKYPTETAIWTSGVANNPFFTKHAELFDLAPNGRANVNDYLQAYDDIYIVGDNNTVKYSGTAWPAFAQAEFVAKHLRRVKNKQTLRRFRPSQPPSAIPIGSNWGYVEWHDIYLAGKTGYLVRRLIELYGFMKILKPHAAIAAWRAHDLPEITFK